MKVRIFLLAVSLALGVTMAQTTPANPPSQEPQQQNTKTNAGSAAATAAPAEMKNKTFKGVLVDMSCASHASGTTASAAADSGAAASDSKHSANRTTSDSGANCPVSASSSQLGMKLDDGNTVSFDLVGNQRAQDALKNDKGWGKEISAHRPIHAKVTGVLDGDKLIVSAIH
jgi:hypothetical protein